MKTENGKIIEATRRELCNIWITDDWEDFVPFPDFLRHLEQAGVKIVKEGEDGNQRTTH